MLFAMNVRRNGPSVVSADIIPHSCVMESSAGGFVEVVDSVEDVVVELAPVVCNVISDAATVCAVEIKVVVAGGFFSWTQPVTDKSASSRIIWFFILERALNMMASIP